MSAADCGPPGARPLHEVLDDPNADEAEFRVHVEWLYEVLDNGVGPLGAHPPHDPPGARPLHEVLDDPNADEAEFRVHAEWHRKAADYLDGHADALVPLLGPLGDDSPKRDLAAAAQLLDLHDRARLAARNYRLEADVLELIVLPCETGQADYASVSRELERTEARAEDIWRESRRIYRRAQRVLRRSTPQARSPRRQPQPRRRRTAARRAAGPRAGSDPGDDDPDGPPRPRLSLAPPPRAILTYAVLTADERGAA